LCSPDFAELYFYRVGRRSRLFRPPDHMPAKFSVPKITLEILSANQLKLILFITYSMLIAGIVTSFYESTSSLITGGPFAFSWVYRMLYHCTMFS
jgi:hypothetical protein